MNGSPTKCKAFHVSLEKFNPEDGVSYVQIVVVIAIPWIRIVRVLCQPSDL